MRTNQGPNTEPAESVFEASQEHIAGTHRTLADAFRWLRTGDGLPNSDRLQQTHREGLGQSRESAGTVAGQWPKRGAEAPMAPGLNRRKYRVEPRVRSTIFGRGPIPPNTLPAIEHRPDSRTRAQQSGWHPDRAASRQSPLPAQTRKPNANSQLCRRSPEKERLQNRFRCSPVSPNRNRTPTPSQLVVMMMAVDWDQVG
jgi:hypothetical protein